MSVRQQNTDENCHPLSMHSIFGRGKMCKSVTHEYNAVHAWASQTTRILF